MLADGVTSASDIDTAMRLGYKHQWAHWNDDLVGLDVREIFSTTLLKHSMMNHTGHTLLNKLVEAGELSKKSGKGFYLWSDEGKTNETTFEIMSTIRLNRLALSRHSRHLGLDSSLRKCGLRASRRHLPANFLAGIYRSCPLADLWCANRFVILTPQTWLLWPACCH